MGDKKQRQSIFDTFHYISPFYMKPLLIANYFYVGDI